MAFHKIILEILVEGDYANAEAIADYISQLEISRAGTHVTIELVGIKVAVNEFGVDADGDCGEGAPIAQDEDGCDHCGRTVENGSAVFAPVALEDDGRYCSNKCLNCHLGIAAVTKQKQK